jgi:GT2 family glycosyltransferase/2-polyprenyl-3-methyl-5-hydroxy-6-metoxy-1,4-benzoquinol methylase
VRPGQEGDALRYEATVDLSETNTARTQLVLMTGENKKVLEVGPATGYITKALRERGCRIIGLEIDSAAAKVSAEFAERMIVGNIEAMALEEVFGDELFDVVMYGDVLEHLVDPERTLVKTKSILAPGGRVVASIPNVAHASVRLALLAGEFRYRPDGLLDRTHLRFFTRQSIHALFEAAGYQLDEVRTSTAGPFGTEMGLSEEDFPPRLAEAVMSLPDADTYQFILTARPAAGIREVRTRADVTSARAGPLWRVENDLARREQALAERESALAALKEEVAWLRQVVRRTEDERDAARAELAGVKASRAYRMARGAARRFRRMFPSRNRAGGSRPSARPAEYREWIERSEPGPAELERQRSTSFPYSPLIDVTVIAGGGSEHRTMRSLGAQTYGRFEVGAGSGEFVAFVDAGDAVAPFALHAIVGELNRDPDVDVLYSDSDTISDDGVRSDPVFTPEWSPDLLLSTDYTSHLLCVRRELLEEVGGLRPGMREEQLWDLSLRLSERTDRISRIPAILYHRRAGVVRAAGARAVREHLDRTDRSGSIERTPEGHLRIAWTLRGDPKASLIIPTLHNRTLVERCLAAVEQADYPNREVLLVETAGREAGREAWYDELSRRFRFEVLWWEEPFNYSAVNNWAAKQAAGDVLVFLNDDTEAVGDGWLRELVGWVQQERIGAVGAQLLNEDGTIQHGGIIVRMTGFAGQLFKFLRPGDWSMLGSTMWYRNVLAVTGACMAMRRDVFERVGGWDERYLLAGSDVELGLRLHREGYRVVCTPFAQLRHTEQATRGSEILEQDFHASFGDYREFLAKGDPFWNPNLSYDATIPALDTGEDASIRTLSAILGRDVQSELREFSQRTRLR